MFKLLPIYVPAIMNNLKFSEISREFLSTCFWILLLLFSHLMVGMELF